MNYNFNVEYVGKRYGGEHYLHLVSLIIENHFENFMTPAVLTERFELAANNCYWELGNSIRILTKDG